MSDYNSAAATAAVHASEKIRAIIDADVGKAFPAFAQFLALETDVSVADALKIMTAVRGGIASMSTASLAATDRVSGAAVDAGWKAAVDTANARVETLATTMKAEQRPVATGDGWGAAVAAANAKFGAN